LDLISGFDVVVFVRNQTMCDREEEKKERQGGRDAVFIHGRVAMSSDLGDFDKAKRPKRSCHRWNTVLLQYIGIV
jgi:hypothetical protein